jgi:hypothetical protein
MELTRQTGTRLVGSTCPTWAAPHSRMTATVRSSLAFPRMYGLGVRDPVAMISAMCWFPPSMMGCGWRVPTAPKSLEAAYMRSTD